MSLKPPTEMASMSPEPDSLKPPTEFLEASAMVVEEESTEPGAESEDSLKPPTSF